ncbi:MAG: hypothetical protein WCZ18_02200 [Ottowia sp.]|nr:hypothetical protein [Ottowia sp.]
MTTSTLTWKQSLGAAAAERAPAPSGVATDRRGKRATRRLGVALLAAVVAAVMVGASSLLAGEGQGGGVLTWLALWIVGFAALLIFGRAAFAAAAMLQARWTRHQENIDWWRQQREMTRAAQDDPRLWRELQIMQDRREWRNG